MTSIKFFKQMGTTSQSIISVKHFLDKQPYEGQSYGGADFFLYTVLPHIREYMTANLFSQKASQDKIREVDVLGVPVGTSEQTRGRTQHVALAGTEEEFNNHLASMEATATKIEDARKDFEDKREKVLDILASSDEVKALKLPPSVTDPFLRDPMPKTVAEFQNAFQKSVDSLPKIFEFVRSHMMKKIDADLETKYNNEKARLSDWSKEDLRLYKEDPEGYADEYGAEAGDELAEVYEFIAFYENLDAEHYWAQTLKGLEGMGDIRIARIKKANGEKDDEEENDEEKEEIDQKVRRAELLAVYTEYRKAKDNDQLTILERRERINAMEIDIMKGLISTYKEMLEKSDDTATGVLNLLAPLEDFWKTLLAIILYMEKERDKLTLIDGYNRDGKPTGRNIYQAIYEAEREQEKSRQLGIPYMGYLTTYHDHIPDYSEAKFVPKTLRQFPNADEIALLNELDGMLVKRVTITDERIVGTGTAAKTTKESREELLKVGYILKPGYMIKVKSVGLTVDAEMYNGHPTSLPSRNKSIEDFLGYTSSFRERRRGKVYCVFYIDRVPHAADEDHIYTLAPRARSEFAVSVAKQLAELSEYVSMAGRSKTTYQEIVRRLDEIYSGAQGAWKNNNISSFHRLEDLQLFAPRLSDALYGAFEKKLSDLIASVKDDDTSNGPTLDLYTYEALLYVFGLTKVNLEQEGKSKGSQINYNDSVHTPDTYATVSVRRPDDLFYNKSNGLPYDVMILRHNIAPRIIISEILQMTLTRRKKVGGIDKSRREKTVNADYPDRAWSRKIKGFNTNRGDMAPIEVFDTSTMSKVTYCNPNDYAVEVLTGPSLQLDNVIARLELLSRGKINYRQYSLPADINSRLATHLRETVANPLFAHYLASQHTEITIGEKEKKIVQQALRGIAYSLYCKLSASIGRVQDLTAVINSASPVFSKCVFTHNVLQRKNAQTPGMQVPHREGLYVFKCIVESVSGEEARLMPIREDPVRRLLTLVQEEDRELYFDYLESFLEQETNLVKTFSAPKTSDPKRRKSIENLGVPDLLKAQTIARVLDRTMSDISEEKVDEFINIIKNGMQLPRAQSATSILTSYGLIALMNSAGNVLSVEDIVLDDKNKEKKKDFRVPFTMKTTITIEKREKQETSFDEPFIGSMDMTFLTLLDQAMYPGEHTLINRLHGMYHTYDSGHFASEVLGTFLWSEFVEKVWSLDAIKRIYHLISYQPRNLILRTTERVTLREGTTFNMKPLILARRNLVWL